MLMPSQVITLLLYLMINKILQQHETIFPNFSVKVDDMIIKNETLFLVLTLAKTFLVRHTKRLVSFLLKYAILLPNFVLSN